MGPGTRLPVGIIPNFLPLIPTNEKYRERVILLYIDGELDVNKDSEGRDKIGYRLLYLL